MRKLIFLLAAFLPIGFCAGADGEPVQSIVKIGYHTQSDDLNGADIDTTGFVGSFERVTSSDSFLSYYGMLALVETEASANGVSLDLGDFESIGFGLKYNFMNSGIEDYSEGLDKGMFYARLGWERAKFTISSLALQIAANNGVPIASTSITESGILLGLGYEKLFEQFGVYAEMMRHSEDTFDDDSLNFGVFFKF
jgi:hypothetical protein